MDWSQAKDLIIEFLAAGICTVLVYELHELRTSVNSLNEKMALIIERTTSHETRISKLEAKHDT